MFLYIVDHNYNNPITRIYNPCIDNNNKNLVEKIYRDKFAVTNLYPIIL